MRSIAVSLAAGLLFGVGLMVSGMAQPAKVLGFLNVAGDWDPSLAFVMLGAIAVHFLAYRLVPRLPRPVWGTKWAIPSRRDIDLRLVVGAALFGAGWGLAGYCPGPALTGLASGASTTWLFTGAMGLGMLAFHVWEASRAPRSDRVDV